MCESDKLILVPLVGVFHVSFIAHDTGGVPRELIRAAFVLGKGALGLSLECILGSISGDAIHMYM